MRPLHPVSPGTRTVLGISFFVLFVAFWAWITLGGHVNRIFLADPLSMLRDGWRLLVEDRFWVDILITIWRVFGGFVLASVAAVPIGIAMGAWKPVEAFMEPFVSFARYLPASAFIPLLILWAGIGELEKLLVIFVGSVWQIILIIAVKVGSTRRDLVEGPYAGSTDNGIVSRVIIPANAPEIADTAAGARLGVDLFIVAEPIGSSSGMAT
jgi:NitT/TauT family transport system permease protein